MNPFVYWIVRAILQPFFHVWFRLGRIGREHIPAAGPVILASNHRSFLDPFVIAVMARRPIYFVAKQELFRFHPVVSWLLSALGAFPIDRGAADQESMATARAILERGDVVLMFPEGTRIAARARSAAPARRRAPGARDRRAGRPGRRDRHRGGPARLAHPPAQGPHPRRPRADVPEGRAALAALAGAVTDRIWPCVELQWEWLGGLPRLHRAAVIGAGSWGTGLAVALARAGLEVDLGAAHAEQAGAHRRTARNDADLPGVSLPDGVNAVARRPIELEHHDLVVLAVPAHALPAAVGRARRLASPRAPASSSSPAASSRPPARCPTAYVAERVRARAVGCLAGPGADGALAEGAAIVAAAEDEPFLAQIAAVLRAAGLDVTTTREVAAVQLAGTTASAEASAAARARPRRPTNRGARAPPE